MKLSTLYTTIRRFIPFIIIVVVIVVFLERQKKPSLPPPALEVSSLDIRSPNNKDFELPNLSGTTIRLSDFKGSVVLLNFFATWCPGCREEMPSLEEIYQANKNKGFLVLGIAGDPQGKEKLEPFVKEYGLTFPILLDPENQVFRQYYVRGIPVTYLLDKQGRIAGMYLGEADWSSNKAQMLIDHLLQEPYDEKDTTS